ncbi:MAG: TerB family tellurite resistance protein [Nitrospinales bacterium]
MSHFKKLTLLKILTVIAWADGEIALSELNVLKSFYRKFNLSPEEIEELNPYLRAPLSEKEQENLFRKFAAEVTAPGDKKEFLQAMELMAGADKEIHEREQALLRRLTALLEDTSFTEKTLGKIRNVLARVIFKPARETKPQLQKYFKNIVLNKVGLRADGEKAKISLSEDQLYLACLFGVLLGSVAFVDETFSDEEKNALRGILSAHYSFTDEELEIILDVLEEQTAWGFDFYEVVTEFNRLVSYPDRVKLMDCFFEISAADGDLGYEEVEEIRRITKAMRIPHKDFIDCKMKYLGKFR